MVFDGSRWQTLVCMRMRHRSFSSSLGARLPGRPPTPAMAMADSGPIGPNQYPEFFQEREGHLFCLVCQTWSDDNHEDGRKHKNKCGWELQRRARQARASSSSTPGTSGMASSSLTAGTSLAAASTPPSEVLWESLRTLGTQTAVLDSRITVVENQGAKAAANLQLQVTQLQEQVASLQEVIQGLQEVIQGLQNPQWTTADGGWDSRRNWR